MPIDRKDWLSPFDHLPRWGCPNCTTGHLVLRKADATKGLETRQSRVNRAATDISPEWIEHRFATVVSCDNPGCRQIASVTGTREGYEDCIPNGEGDYWRERLHIDSVLPAPMPIHIPAKVPERIRTPIEAAARLYWTSAAASGNALRQSVERFLDYKGIKKGKPKPLSLNVRLAEFKEKHKRDTSLLSAVRWLGNEASHEGTLEYARLLSAFEMIEHVLEEEFVGHTRRLAKEARSINSPYNKPKFPKKPN